MTELEHQQVFLRHFQSVIECFPAIKSQAKIKRIHYFLRDISENGMIEIFNAVIDNFKHTPTPNDFHESAQAWSRKQSTFNPDSQVAVCCANCGDLGILHLTANDNSGLETLINCDCKTSIAAPIKAPVWDNYLSIGFNKSKCPLEWFKTKSESFDVGSSEIKALSKKWKSRIVDAEKYWHRVGF